MGVGRRDTLLERLEQPAPLPDVLYGMRGMLQDGRGRHATAAGTGFGRVIGWSILGTLLPGAGLVAAGRRVAGWTVIGLESVLLATAGGYLLTGGDVVATVGSRAVDPDFLLLAAAAAAGAALVLGVLVLWTHLALRRGAALTRPQRAVASVLVLGLILLGCAPLGRAASYALIQRDLLTSVFAAEGGRPPDTSAQPKPAEADPWAGIERVNTLLVGSDAGADRTGMRPDSMVLASADPRTGSTVLITIPRNLVRAPFPAGSEGAKAYPHGFGPVRSSGLAACGENQQFCWFNAVYQTTNTSAREYFPGDDDPGLTATRQLVEGVTGLHVDYYAMLDLRGFQDFVQAIGGVTVDVHQALPIGGSSEHRVAVGGYIEAGRNQHLDGYHALWFARSRWASDDYDRTRRQRCVVAAAAAQADPVTLAQHFPALARSIEEHFSTDIPLDDLKAWVALGLRIKHGRVTSFGITKATYGGSYTHPDYDRIHAAVQESLHPAKPSAGATPTPSTPLKPSTPSKTRAATPGTAQDVADAC